MSLHLNVSPQAEALFTTAAQRRGIEPARLFEEMVADYLSQPEASEETNGSLYERSEDVIGIVEGLPTDMSQNPGKYMKGFGETKAA
jgi:hypothetical protein